MPSAAEWWSQSQLLRQESEMDCGVCVFGALRNLTRDEILLDLPDTVNGQTVLSQKNLVQMGAW
jgi:hypothetical protein